MMRDLDKTLARSNCPVNREIDSRMVEAVWNFSMRTTARGAWTNRHRCLNALRRLALGEPRQMNFWAMWCDQVWVATALPPIDSAEREVLREQWIHMRECARACVMQIREGMS